VSKKDFLYGQWYDECMRRAVIYARVSTVDGRQDPETQLRQLREYAERRGFPVAHEYVDYASGAKNDRVRVGVPGHELHGHEF
jgi:predicted site-specific integrase-resolvase